MATEANRNAVLEITEFLSLATGEVVDLSRDVLAVAHLAKEVGPQESQPQLGVTSQLGAADLADPPKT
jgi:hypothetical protein